jgi:phosphatidylglycerol---prolipoprotein diacylglyceryl transferase
MVSIFGYSPLGLRYFSPYGEEKPKGKALILYAAADAANVIHWSDFGLHPVLFELGPLKIRWYSLAYIFGIIIGWWYLAKLASLPGSPMARRHVDDFIFYVTLGIILGGRLGYSIFYNPDLLANPLDVLKLWEGGMSFHGGVIGVILAILWFCRSNGLNWMRVMDYVTVVYPIGHFLGRLANFVNGELWGKATDVSWGMIFPGAGDAIARHPSQLYAAGLEGLMLGLILWFLAFRTQARYYPGMLAGAGALAMGVLRFIVEIYREPDAGVTGLFGLSMGQTLCLPMIVLGAWLIWSAKSRRQRVESVSGQDSVA